MTLKEFFKPTTRKMILFGLFLLLEVIGIIIILGCAFGGCGKFIVSISLFCIYLLTPIFKILSIFGMNPNLEFANQVSLWSSFLKLILYLVWLYLISCIIISIYNKIKK